MSLLHATWLYPPSGAGGRLLLWADTWRVADPVTPGEGVSDHPLALDLDAVGGWLDDNDLWTDDLRPAEAVLSLPSRSQAARGKARTGHAAWSGMPLQAGEPIPKEPFWWPWPVRDGGRRAAGG